MDLLLATRNTHKTREIQRILGLQFQIRDLSDYPELPETIENGRTFEENAVLKAIAASRVLPGFVISDDSGLEVDALGGAPGIYSARYAGKGATDKENMDKLLRELVPFEVGEGRRSARFRCVMALAQDGRVLETFDGAVEGTIVDAPRGAAGFGYDPIFKPDGFDRTFGELEFEEKDRLSHRARALERLRAWLSA